MSGKVERSANTSRRRAKEVAEQTVETLDDMSTEAVASMDDLGTVQERRAFSTSLVTQGKHRFFALTLYSHTLAETCVVEPYEDDPTTGFQRLLDQARVQEIADYIDSGFGTIPTSIILSAQPAAELEYRSKRRSITFNLVKGAFLILDGQHRVAGFAKARTNLRVPVVIYENLTRREECRLFIDINTKQRPVPSSLLLAIKKVANIETSVDAILNEIFEKFSSEPRSPLVGLLTSSERAVGKISRVTFYTSLKPLVPVFSEKESDQIYEVLLNYLVAVNAGLEALRVSGNLVKASLFRAIMSIFPEVVRRVQDKCNSQYTPDNFASVMDTIFSKARTTLKSPDASVKKNREALLKALQQPVTI